MFFAEEKQKMNNKRKTLGIILGIVAFVVIICGLFAVHHFFGPDVNENENLSENVSEDGENVNDEELTNVTIEVVSKDGKKTSYSVKTAKETLYDAMTEAEGLTFEGVDQSAGFMITHVNGERAVYELDKAYWAIYVNDQYGMCGAREQALTDGDVYKLEYTKG